MTGEEKNKDMPKVNLKFLFVMCNDVAVMRHFYTDLMKMEETSFQDDKEWGWLCYKSDGLDFMFFRAHEEMPVIKEWVWQPGWGGDIAGTSWAIHIPVDMFAGVVNAIRGDGGVTLLDDYPVWRQDSYWGFTVKDPMGNSVEVYTKPAEKPVDEVWPKGT